MLREMLQLLLYESFPWRERKNLYTTHGQYLNTDTK